MKQERTFTVLVAQTQWLDFIFWIGTALFFSLLLMASVRKSFKYALPAIPIVMVGLFAALGEWESVRGFINWLLGPQRLLVFPTFALVMAMLYYHRWTQPLFAGALLVILAITYLLSAFDPNFFLIVTKADNVPITLMIFAIVFFIWLAFRQMSINDRRMGRGEWPIEAQHDDKVLSWPYLVYIELIGFILVCTVLIVWSIFLRAPLEQPANPHLVPNPSKAPWYFVGLQELLVYFDPWIAGVLLPGLIVFGLCALPYLDKNPKGNGYYTLKERPFAITIFLAGFIVLWIVPIVLGTFLRGPNWSFFGPYEYWDPNRSDALTNVNLSDLFWVDWLGRSLPTGESAGKTCYFLLRESPGLAVLAAYFLLLPLVLRLTVFRRLYARMGFARYSVMIVLLAGMGLVPIKMLLRWLFNLKYIIAITEWSFNV